ncbi:MAG: acylphosphatase [Patescibacteria group bacterium]
MEKHLMIKIFGKVQGVSFRYYAREEALKLNLCGFVRNEFGGAVCIEAEGEEKSLQKFLDWCRRGTDAARVEKIEFAFSVDLKKFIEFEVF